MTTNDIDLEELLDIDPGRIPPPIRTRISEYIANRERRMEELLERAIDAESEVEVVRGRLEELQDEVVTLRDRLADRDADRAPLDPSIVVSSFGEVLESERLRAGNFAVSDIQVDLRANVVHTDEGVRVTLPSPGATVAPESLSDLRFSVRSAPELPELDYEEVPDVRGLHRERAGSRLVERGLEVGTVETAVSDREEGTVLEQMPSPFSLAAPTSAVDLVVAEHRVTEMADLIGRSLPDAVRFIGDRYTLGDITSVPSDAPPGTIINQQPAPGADIPPDVEVSVTISAFPARQEDEERLEEEEASQEDQAVGRVEIAGEDVTEIDGIGETFGDRLRRAGLETIAHLRDAEPIEVAEAADVTRDRAREWIEAAHERLREADREGGRGGDRADESGEGQ